MNDAEFSGRVDQAKGQIYEWSQEFTVPPPLRVPGNELTLDDEIYVAFRPSDVVFQSLQSAVSHLHFFAKWLDLSGHNWNPCLYTVLRSALMGSCQALYVIGPEQRVERQARAVRIMLGDVRYEKQLLNDGKVLISDEARAIRLKQLEDFEEEAKSVPAQLGVHVVTPSTTDVIVGAMKLMPDQGKFKDMFPVAVDALWRGGSAQAHANPLLKFMLMPIPNTQDRSDGSTFGVAQISPEHIYGVTGATMRIYARALELYHLRRDTPAFR